VTRPRVGLFREHSASRMIRRPSYQVIRRCIIDDEIQRMVMPDGWHIIVAALGRVTIPRDSSRKVLSRGFSTPTNTISPRQKCHAVLTSLCLPSRLLDTVAFTMVDSRPNARTAA
jgi:hypothetical protein